MTMETRYFATHDIFIDLYRHFVLKSKILTPYFLLLWGFYSVYFATHQFPFLHALHYHEQDLLWLALTIIESLLNSHQKLVSDVITNQTGRRHLQMNFQLFFVCFFYRGMITEQSRINLKSHPPSSENLCAKEIMSEARPLPSQTTTGIGGSSLRLSRAMEITLGPPSTIRHTRGTPWPKPGRHRKTCHSVKSVDPSIYH